MNRDTQIIAMIRLATIENNLRSVCGFVPMCSDEKIIQYLDACMQLWFWWDELEKEISK